MSWGVGHRRSSDPQLLWLWCRPAAVAPIGPLAWEPPYAKGAALKSRKKKKRKKKKERILIPGSPNKGLGLNFQNIQTAHTAYITQYQKTNNTIKKWAKAKEHIQMVNRHMKRDAQHC